MDAVCLQGAASVRFFGALVPETTPYAGPWMGGNSGKGKADPLHKKTSYLEFKDFLSAAQNNDPSTVGRGIIATDPETKMYFPDPPSPPFQR